MKMKGLRYYFTVGNGAQAHRGEIQRTTDQLIFIKVYSYTGKSTVKIYLMEKINFIESLEYNTK